MIERLKQRIVDLATKKMKTRLLKRLLKKHKIEKKGDKYRYTHPTMILNEGEIWRSIFETGWNKNLKKVMEERRFFILQEARRIKKWSIFENLLYYK